MWPLPIMKILYNALSFDDKKLSDYMAKTRYMTFCRLSVTANQQAIFNHLVRLEKNCDILKLLHNSKSIDTFLHIVQFKILKPIEDVIEAGNWESNLLGLIPLSMQYDYCIPARSTHVLSDISPALSNKRIMQMSKDFVNLKLARQDGSFSAPLDAIRKMLRSLNNENLDLR